MRFPVGKPHAEPWPPWCLVTARDGTARGDVLRGPTVVGMRAQRSLQLRGLPKLPLVGGARRKQPLGLTWCDAAGLG